MPHRYYHLLSLFKKRAVKFGDFTLASGQKSSYYIDSKKAVFSNEVQPYLSRALADRAFTLDYNAVGGLELGSIPLTVLLTAAYPERYLEGFFVRKQAKDHGSKNLIEGCLEPLSKVLILDDVLTTGTSAMKAIKAVEAEGHTVVGVVCIVDRLQGAAELLKGYDFRPLFTIKDLGIEPTGV